MIAQRIASVRPAMYSVSDDDGVVSAGMNRFQRAFDKRDGSIQHRRAM